MVNLKFTAIFILIQNFIVYFSIFEFERGERKLVENNERKSYWLP
jgi:hypothetical protein